MKETEFDRYDRAKKLEREAFAEKRKNTSVQNDNKQKGGRPKFGLNVERKNWTKSYVEEEYDYV